MVKIPEKVAESDLSHLLAKEGLTRVFQGKVRDTYALHMYPDYLLVVATDRISIFDIVLPALVRDKGKILTAMTVFWLTEVLKGYQHHLLAYGEGIDPYLPKTLRGNTELQSRALAVKKLEIITVECVVRGYLTGSGWSSYKKDRKVCGIELPEGLHDGSELPKPIFTPTTKAESGHDIPLTEVEVIDRYGPWIKELSVKLYKKAYVFANRRGIIIADTKFEFGQETLADEVFTPDSSRFWRRRDWEEAVKEKKSPPGWDKQPVREWGKTVETPFGLGINKLDPENPDHLAFIDNLEVPKEVLENTAVRYNHIFSMLTSLTLEEFQEITMGIEG